MRKICSVMIVFLFSVGSALAAIEAKGFTFDFLSDYVSRGWTTEDGMPSNTVTDIIQDESGYMYFGTYEGMVRFDGIDFTIFNRALDDKYDFASARAVFQASDGAIWVGSNNEGVFRIVMDSNREVLAFSTANGLPNNSIRDIEEDAEGNMWIATAGGVVYITKNFDIVTPDEPFIREHSDLKSVCTTLYCDSVGKMWVTTAAEGGIYVFSAGKGQKYKILDPFLENSIVTCVAQDNTEVFWLGIAPHYALRVDAKTSTLFDLSCGENNGTKIDSIIQDKSGNIWFATDTAVVVYRDGKISRHSKLTSLIDSNVNKIMEDREGNIWFATSHDGVQKLNLGLFKTVELPSSVNAIAEGLDKRVWLGLDKGVACYSIAENGGLKREYNEITDFCGEKRVRDISIAQNGDILISTYASLGVVRFSEGGELVGQWTKQSGLTGDKVRVCVESSLTGDLYVGTTTGFNIVDHKTNKIATFTQANALANEYIMCIYEDTADGSIWIGTDGGGVCVMKDGKIINQYTTENGLAGNIIFKITKNSDGAFWICTGTGISRLYDGKFFNYSKSTGLGSDSIFQLLVDDTGNAWLTANTGISSIQMQKMLSKINEANTSLSPKLYSRSDGLKTRGITSTSLSMKDSLGRLWFTLIDGFAIYDPKKVYSNKTKPIVHIEKIMLDDKVLYPTSDTIIIPAGVKRVSIKYTGLSFISSEHVRFSHKLEGFDTNYSEWETSRVVSYTNLKTGKYRFYIIAANGDNVVSAVDSRINFIQEAFFYQTVGFWVAVVLSLFAIAIFIAVHKIRSVQRNERILQQRVDEQTQKIKNLLLNILPAPVAERLENEPNATIAEQVDNVSVLFADIVNFTRITSGMGAQQIVTALNDLYSRFDSRAVAMHIEKIKTIGDSYMVASGLIDKNEHHAERLIEYARGMLQDVKEFNRTSAVQFNIRIGINSGSVIAGVIGKTKYIYDIWGDTVNVASRMEHSGIPDRIHTSLETWELCKDSIAFEEEIVMEIKGKGEMRTFFTK